MTLLTVCKGLALNVGLPTPMEVVISPDREWEEALQMANEAGEELARRVDWGVLTKSTTFAGDGVTQTFTMPGDFDRLAQGVTMRAGADILRPLTQAEWAGLPAAVGAPRYFKLDGSTIRFWPVPSSGVSITAVYVSAHWTAGATGYSADTDTSLLDESLLTKALIVRWRRQKGMPYQDEEGEYEAALADVARFDDRARF